MILLYHCLVAGNDYTGIENSPILLNPENNSVQVPVFITDDSDLEPNEQLILHLELANMSPLVPIAVNDIPLIIWDDDCECLWYTPCITYSFITVTEEDRMGTFLMYT